MRNVAMEWMLHYGGAGLTSMHGLELPWLVILAICGSSTYESDFGCFTCLTLFHLFHDSLAVLLLVVGVGVGCGFLFVLFVSLSSESWLSISSN